MRVSRMLWWALVVALFCLPLFAGLGRTDLQNDESIYSYAAQSILETGDWLNPRSSPTPNIVFVEKPPLKFWLVALPIRLGLLPNDEFGLRFCDALLGSLAFLYVLGIGRRMGGGFCGALACLVLFAFYPLLFDHGLRSDNMEAALLLAYCGGVYHYLRWTDGGTVRDDGTATSARQARRHALAVGAYVFLGFMTKFVAVAFLPLVLGAATLLVPPVRAKFGREWRTWVGAAALAAALAAPWFIYEMARWGGNVWKVMLFEHVFLRFSGSLDPAHVQPWNYYFSFLSLFLHQERIFRTAVFAGLVLLVRTLWTRWLEGVVVVTWFVLPLALISFGTSKLGHYAYPFLPPIALALGYLGSSVLRIAVSLSRGELPEWLERGPAGARVQAALLAGRDFYGRARRLVGWLTAWPGGTWVLWSVRIALGLVAAFWIMLAAIALVHPGRLTVAGLVLARNPQPLKLAINAMLIGLVIGRLAWAVRLALPIAIVALAPVTAYHENLPRLMVERHPLRTLSACLSDVREDERRAGRQAGELFVSLPDGYLHPYFFYLRKAGWDMQENLSTEAVARELDKAGPPRPFLLSATPFRPAWEPRTGTSRYRGWTVIDKVVLLLPGPFSRCEKY